MRVTHGMKIALAHRNIADVQARHLKAVNEATTGNRIGVPSDDPIGAAERERIRGALTRVKNDRTTVRSVLVDAELAENALAESGELMQRAREIATWGGNDSLTAEQRATLASEVGQLKNELVALANSKGSRGYIFAGSKTDDRAFDAAGAFQGDDVLQTVQVGTGVPTRVGASGSTAFTSAGGVDVFGVLDALQNALNTNDTVAVRGTMEQVDKAHEQLSLARSDAGMVMSHLTMQDDMLSDLDFELQRQHDGVGGADPIDAYSRLTDLSQSLERSIAIGKQLLDLGGLAKF